MEHEHTDGPGRGLNEKQVAWLEEQREAEKEEAARQLDRTITALEEAAELRALNAAAFAMHVRVPASCDGAARILWNGWLEDWNEFYETYRDALDQTGKPLSAARREELRNYQSALQGFGELFDLAEAIEERIARGERPDSWRGRWFATRQAIKLLRKYVAAVVSTRASRRQLLAPFPGFGRGEIEVPSGVTTH